MDRSTVADSDFPGRYFTSRGWKPHQFQEDTWTSYLEGNHGLLNAPTGSGKTLALWIAVLLEYIRDEPRWQTRKDLGLQVIWITPIRALSEEIIKATQRVLDTYEIPWQVGIRTGDTTSSTRAQQRIRLPELLITTPESLHILLAQRDYPKRFRHLKCVIVDEWHELIGSKRGIQMELALSRLKALSAIKIWGISATIGNLEEATRVLLGDSVNEPYDLIKADIEKQIEVISLLPDTIERFPWSGHLGINLLDQVIPLIEQSESTLIFTNTRSQTEIWYQRLMTKAPHLAGLVAMHHGSISKDIRHWVEDRLHTGKLKGVVCTSSLDLGVDFKPVETIIQIGSPRGVSRFVQRAGRSGHQPGAVSRIYFVPTHSMELIEGAALRQAIKERFHEDRVPMVNAFDVLIQYLVTLAVSEGFVPAQIFKEVLNTHAYQYLQEEEWNWILQFITSGGDSLQVYDEYRKVTVKNGLFRVRDRRIASRHRLSIGTIVGDNAYEIRFMNGRKLGTIEEYFILRLKIGDAFWFAGQSLELVKIRGNDAFVKKTRKKNANIPAWQGGRMNLSSMLSTMIRRKMHEVHQQSYSDPELSAIAPLVAFQEERSHVPALDELLIEYIKTDEGHHVFVYPFEGRFIHEGLSSLVAYRISKLKSLSFSIAFTDYGFELLSDQPIPIEKALKSDLFSSENLLDEMQASINSTEMARRRFRDIATIAGLVFRGYPGKVHKDRHLHANSSIIFEVFEDYETNSLLLKQAYQEVFDFQLEEHRLRSVLDRIKGQKIVLKYPEKPTPFCFPIMADRLRDKFTGEKFEDQVKKMTLSFS